MAPVVILGLAGAGLLLLMNKGSPAKTASPSAPPASDLAKEVADLLATEEDPAVLRHFADELAKLGYSEDAMKLRAKADAIDKKAGKPPTDVIKDVNGNLVDWTTLTTSSDLARWIVLDAEIQGCWRWDTGAVSKFQRAVGLKDDGIIGPKTLGALTFLEPDQRGLFVNCGVLASKAAQAASGAPVNEVISDADIQPILLDPDVQAGADAARKAAQAEEDERARFQAAIDAPTGQPGTPYVNPYGRI